MIPSRGIWEAMQNLLAADTATLANASALHVHLVAQNFVPTLDITLGSLVFATFTGSAALSAGTGTQLTYYDVVEGFRVIELKEPAGGWHWVCTVTPGSPETIYGWAVTDNADAVLYGTALFNQPVTISASGQGLDIANIKYRFATNSPF